MGNYNKLKGGLAVLMGESTPEEKEENIVSTLQDEDLKAKLLERQKEGRGRPKKGRPVVDTEKKYTKVCVVANAEKWQKLRYISLVESKQIKEVLELAMDQFIENYEKQNKKIELPNKTL